MNRDGIKNRNNKGRPVKEIAEKKSYKVTVKMATDEYYTLRGRAALSGVTISEFVRMSILTSIVKQRLTPEHNNYIRKLCGMANNLNQIAKRANTSGYIEARQEYLFLACKIDDLITQIES